MSTPTNSEIALTKAAAERNGTRLTDSEAAEHAQKIAANICSDEDEQDEGGQDFWSAAKEYFLK